jgi:hypothetical protein
MARRADVFVSGLVLVAGGFDTCDDYRAALAAAGVD